MRVALLSSSANPNTGWGRYTVDYCRRLSCVPGIEPTLHVSINGTPPAAGELPIRVIPSLPPWVGTTTHSPTWLHYDPRAVIEDRPDVIHCLVEFPYALIGAAASEARGVPLVVSLHGTYAALPFGHAADREPYRRALKRAAALTAPSAYTARALRTASGEPLHVHVIANAVDATRFTEPADAAAVRSRFSLAATDRLILSVGEPKPRKGFEVLVEAFTQVLAAHPDAALVIAGPGDSARLAARVRQCGVESRTRLVGSVSEQMLVGLFQICEVFALLPVIVNDSFEGYGLVYLEAGACRKPVVATRSGGVPEAVIDGETGLLVPEHDAAAAAEAIGRVLADPALAQRLGGRGFALANARTWTDYVDQMLRIYGSAFARSRAGTG